MKKWLVLSSVFFAVSYGQCNDIKWSFPPTTLSVVNQVASDPQVAIDANGNVVAVWVENNFIKASTKLVNMSWSTEVTLSQSGSSSPYVVSDANGNVTAIWLDHSNIVRAASKSLSGTWSSAVALSQSGASTPDLAVDSAGDTLAVWARNGNVEAATRPFGMNWHSPLTINSTAAAFPRVAIGGSGTNQKAVVVWQGTSGTANVVYASTKPIEGNWSAEQVISDLSHHAANAYVAVDANQNAIAVWYRYDVTGSYYSNVVVQSAAIASTASTWSSPTSLSAPGMRNPANLVAGVAYDSIGNAIALWNTSFDGETFNVESSVLPVRGNWTAPVDLVSSNLFANAADFSVTSFGDVLAAYLFYNGNSLLIQSVESGINAPITNAWSTPINFSIGADNGFPQIAASLSGNVINAVTVWVTSNGMNNSGSIVASTGSRTLVLPPNNLTVVQSTANYGVFPDVYNTLSWQASSDPNVAGYLIFRDGIFLKQVSSSVLQITDHNQVHGGQVTYSVSAIDSQLSQSRTVSVNFP